MAKQRHALAYFADGNNNEVKAELETDCDGGVPVIDDYDSRGAAEGWADFYAIYTWNDVGTYGCDQVAAGNVNWDLAGSEEYDSYVAFPCDGDPIGDTPNVIDGESWMADVHGLAECDNADGISSQIDWTRFYWDLVRTYALPFDTVVALYDGADPKDWNSTPGSPSSDNPAERFAASAADYPSYESFILTAAADNGVDP